MRVVFMGTPDFAVPVLNALVEAGHEVVCAFTQPDKPKGRGKEMQAPPVKEAALAMQIPVEQPKRVREPEEIEKIKALRPDVIVVVAFGQILPQEILDIPRYGCVNVHASLLPKYRGAAPIQWVIIDGEEKTGITIMRMDKGLDTGDMIEKCEVAIAPDETGESLHDKLAALGGPLLVETLKKIEDGTAVYTKQEGETCYASMLTKTLGQIDWTKPAVQIERLVRGLNSWPSAYTKIGGKTVKIWKAQVLAEEVIALPGTIVRVEKDRFVVATGEGCLAVLEVQAEGKKKMDTAAFLRGNSVTEGMML